MFRGEGETGKRAVVVAEAAVIAPHREEDVFDLSLAARLHAGGDRHAGIVMIVPELVPGPDAAAHDGLFLQRAVTRDPVGVERLVLVIIVPVDQLDLLRNIVGHFFGNDALLVVVVVTLAAAAEEHVGPHHRLEAMFPAEGHHVLQVAVDDVETGFLAVKCLEFPVADAVRFIHAEVDSAAADAVLPGHQHLFDECIRSGLIHQENPVDIVDRAVAGPAEHLLQVCQGLDAGDHFNAQTGRVVVDLPDLRQAVVAAHGAKKRFALDMVGLLRVEHHRVVAEDRQAVQIRLHVVDRHHGVA